MTGTPSRARSIRALVAAVVLGIGVRAVVACSGSEGATSSSTTLDGSGVTTPSAPLIKLYTEAAADPSPPAQPIVIGIGQQFAIVLAAEPATGYSWQPVALADPALVLTIGTEFRGPGEAYEGSPETQILRYVGKAVGVAHIALHYSRPASATPDDKVLTFTINVVLDPSTTTTTAPPVDTSAPDTSVTTAPKTTTTRPRSTTTTKPKTTTTTSRRTTTTT